MVQKLMNLSFGLRGSWWFNFKTSDWWQFWEILRPFHPQFKSYLWRVVLYEFNQMLASSIASIVILLITWQSPLEHWIGFFVALVVYYYIWMKQDVDYDWHICVEHIFPIYIYLKKLSFDKLIGQDMAWHDSNNTAVLAKKVNKGVDKIQETLDMTRWEFIPTVIQMIFTVAVMMWFVPILGLSSLLNSLAFFYITWQSHLAKKGYRALRHDLEDKESQKFNDYVKGVATVQTYDNGFAGRDYFRSLLNQMRLWIRECKIVFRKINPKRILLLQGFKIFYWIILVYQCTNGYISVALLVFLFSLETRMYHALWRMGKIFDRVSESSESIERLFELLKQEPGIKEAARVLPDDQQSKKENHLAVQHIGFRYPSADSDHPLITDISFECATGEVIGIVGSTGSGKSTLTKLVRRWYDVDAGCIKLNGQDIRDLPLSEVQNMFAVIPQADNIVIFDDTLRFNLRFANRQASEAVLLRALEQALLLDDVLDPAKFPEGLETQLGAEGVTLSGGQKQRLATAMAVLSERPYIIMDEPTSALDAKTEKLIRDNFRSLMHNTGQTVIVIAHRLKTISDWADRIVVLDGGTVAEQGSHQELIAIPGGVYANLVKHQEL